MAGCFEKTTRSPTTTHVSLPTERSVHEQLPRPRWSDRTPQSMDAQPAPANSVTTTSSVYVEDPGSRGFIEPALIKRILVLGLPVIIGMMTFQSSPLPLYQ